MAYKYEKYNLWVNEFYTAKSEKVLKTGGAGFHREIQSFSTGGVGKVDFFGRVIIPVPFIVALDIFVRL